MSLLERSPSGSATIERGAGTLPAGLMGSHRQFLRNWSASLSGAWTPPQLFGPAGEGSLAGERGGPWPAEAMAQPPVGAPHSRRAFLLPPTPIARSADVTAAVGALLDLRHRLPGFQAGGAILYTLCTLISEMGQNICEHSRSDGCITVCWYDNGPGVRPAAAVGIVDGGIGIRTSITERLRSAGQPAELTDAEAITRALELPYLDDAENRGTGLPLSRGLIQRHGGVMHIRSGSAVVSVGPAAKYLVGGCSAERAALPGTQIGIYLPPL